MSTNLLQSYFQKNHSKDAPTYLRIKVVPKSPKTEVKEITSDETHGDTIKLRIKAAPEKGKANEELIKFLSKELDIPKESISIISGHTHQLKLLKISHY